MREGAADLDRLDQLAVVQVAAFRSVEADADQLLELRVGDLARLAEEGEKHRPLPDRQVITRHDRTTLFVAKERRGTGYRANLRAGRQAAAGHPRLPQIGASRSVGRRRGPAPA